MGNTTPRTYLATARLWDHIERLNVAYLVHLAGLFWQRRRLTCCQRNLHVAVGTEIALWSATLGSCPPHRPPQEKKKKKIQEPERDDIRVLWTGLHLHVRVLTIGSELAHLEVGRAVAVATTGGHGLCLRGSTRARQRVY